MKIKPGATMSDHTRRRATPAGFYWQFYRGQWVMRRKPTKRPGPPSALQQQVLDEFKTFAAALKNVAAWDQVEAEAISWGSLLTWRDVMATAMLGRLVVIDGVLPEMAYPDLDMLGRTPGGLIFRDPGAWILLPPGNQDQQLVMDGGMPNWRDPPLIPGGGGARGLFSDVISADRPSISGTGLSNSYSAGSAVAADNLAGISITLPPGTGQRTTGLYTASVPGVAYTRNVLVTLTSGGGDGTNNPGVAYGWTDGTKCHSIGYYEVGTGAPVIQVQKRATATSTATTDYSVQRAGFSKPIFFQIEDNLTTVFFRYSHDGQNWITAFSVAKASGYLGSTGYSSEIFIVAGAANNDGTNKTGTLMSWA